MILDVFNVLGMFCILLSVIILIFVLVQMFIQKKFMLRKITAVIITLLVGLVIIFVVSLNHNYVNNDSKIYTNPNNTIPLSMNIVSGAKVNYSYDKRYIYKFRHDGQDVFRLSPVMIKKDTNLKVTQTYRNNFLVPTVETNNIKIIKRN